MPSKRESVLITVFVSLLLAAALIWGAFSLWTRFEAVEARIARAAEILAEANAARGGRAELEAERERLTSELDALEARLPAADPDLFAFAGRIHALVRGAGLEISAYTPIEATGLVEFTVEGSAAALCSLLERLDASEALTLLSIRHEAEEARTSAVFRVEYAQADETNS